MRTGVQSLASFSGLRIHRSSNWTPSLGTSICCACGHKKKKKHPLAHPTLPLHTYMKLKIKVWVSAGSVFFFFVFVFCFFAFSRAASTAYGGSQTRGPIGARATGLRHSHSSNLGSERSLRPTPQLKAMPDS